MKRLTLPPLCDFEDRQCAGVVVEWFKGAEVYGFYRWHLEIK
jgi:hypothetical protein